MRATGPVRMSHPLKAWPGQILDDRFLLVEEIGHGGMSTIFKAEDLEDGGKAVAVKVPLPLFASGLGSWSMFQREEEIARRLDHPYILKFVALPLERRRSYMVTEYVPGPTLADRLSGGRPLPEAEALAIASRLCDAVDYLHRQEVVHYDIKPANVILCSNGSIRLVDFGLAHPASNRQFSWVGAAPAVASSAYAAPEQIQRRRGRKSVDIYAVGATLYEMLTGQPPFPGDDPFVVASARIIGDPIAPRALNPNLSPQAEEITLRALARKAQARYPSAAAMKADLDRPSSVALSGIAGRLKPVTRRRRLLRRARYAGLVVVLPLVTQAALFAFLWWHFSHPR
jgi:serine/threonine-protein kinase